VAGGEAEGAAKAAEEGEFVVGGAPALGPGFLNGGGVGQVAYVHVAIGVEPGEREGDGGEEKKGEADDDEHEKAHGGDQGEEIPGSLAGMEGEGLHDEMKFNARGGWVGSE
jgi:hypothetical protein